MPARAQAAIFDTQEKRLGVAIQNGSYDVPIHGRATTVGATSANIRFDSVKNPNPSGDGGGLLRIPEGTSVQFRIQLTCVNATDDPGTSLNYGQGYEIVGVIRNLNGTTALPAAGVTVTTLDGTASHVFTSSNVTVTADDTNDALNIAVLGIAAKTYYWHATAYINAVSFFGT